MLKNSILLTVIGFCLCSVYGKPQSQVQLKKTNDLKDNSSEKVPEKSLKLIDKLQDPTLAGQNVMIQNVTQIYILAESEVDRKKRLVSVAAKNDSEKQNRVLSVVRVNQTNINHLKRKGTVSKIGYFPAQTDVKDASTSKHRCSGTLVEDKHVLSTAHCVINSVAKELAVMAGDVSLLPGKNPTREIRRVQLIAMHPDYMEGEEVAIEFDIAVLKLDMPFTRGNYLHPIMIPTKKVAHNTLCFIVGWGLGLEMVDSSKIRNSYELYYSDVFTMDMENCYKCVGNAICAGNNQTEACIGDEGGPLMCNGVLHGIYIASANNCQSMSGIYTDVVFYKHWIDRIVEWGGYGSMPVPLPYARKRTFTVSKIEMQNRSHRIMNAFSSIFPLLIVFVLIP